MCVCVCVCACACMHVCTSVGMSVLASTCIHEAWYGENRYQVSNYW